MSNFTTIVKTQVEEIRRNFVHSLEVEVFKIISLKIGLVSSVPQWNMIHMTATTMMKNCMRC